MTLDIKVGDVLTSNQELGDFDWHVYMIDARDSGNPIYRCENGYMYAKLLHEHITHINGKPISEAATTWEGGLPPVGTVCLIEEFTASHGWRLLDHEYRIDFIGKNTVVATTHRTPREVERAFTSTVKFRPIPTPEQIAAEEREQVFDEVVEDLRLVGWVSLGSSHKTVIKDMIMLGYRKQKD